MAYVLDIIPGFSFIAIFVTADLQTKFQVTVNKPNAKENFHIAASLLFYILWQQNLDNIIWFFEIYYHTLSQGP